MKNVLMIVEGYSAKVFKSLKEIEQANIKDDLVEHRLHSYLLRGQTVRIEPDDPNMFILNTDMDKLIDISILDLKFSGYCLNRYSKVLTYLNDMEYMGEISNPTTLRSPYKETWIQQVERELSGICPEPEFDTITNILYFRPPESFKEIINKSPVCFKSILEEAFSYAGTNYFIGNLKARLDTFINEPVTDFTIDRIVAIIRDYDVNLEATGQESFSKIFFRMLNSLYRDLLVRTSDG